MHEKKLATVRLLTAHDEECVEKLDEMSGNYVGQWLEGNEDYAWGMFVGEELIGYCTIGYADDCAEIITSHPAWTDDAMYLSDVYIIPEHRRKGYGTEMIRTAIEHRRKVEKEPVFLRYMHCGQVPFYKKIGFINIGDNAMFLPVANDKNGANPGRCFLVQFRHPDEGTWCDMYFPSAIIDHLGYRDCSGCEIAVYDVHEFGKAVKLAEDANISWPSNYHRLINEWTGEVVIEGYSQEH